MVYAAAASSSSSPLDTSSLPILLLLLLPPLAARPSLLRGRWSRRRRRRLPGLLLVHLPHHGVLLPVVQALEVVLPLGEADRPGTCGLRFLRGSFWRKGWGVALGGERRETVRGWGKEAKEGGRGKEKRGVGRAKPPQAQIEEGEGREGRRGERAGPGPSPAGAPFRRRSHRPRSAPNRQSFPRTLRAPDSPARARQGAANTRPRPRPRPRPRTKHNSPGTPCSPPRRGSTAPSRP